MLSWFDPLPSEKRVTLWRPMSPELAGSEVLLPTHGAPYDLTLRPWESRIHRL